jgi:adenine deaminase
MMPSCVPATSMETSGAKISNLAVLVLISNSIQIVSSTIQT